MYGYKNKNDMKLFTKNGYWNGEPKATFTACNVRLIPDPAHPLWWHNAFPDKEIQAIEITYDAGKPWLIANDDGTGYYKVTAGMGSPQCGHKSLSTYQFIRYIPEYEMIVKIDRDLIKENERIIDDYHRFTNPKEYDRIQHLKEAAQAFSKMTPKEQVEHIRKNMMVK